MASSRSPVASRPTLTITGQGTVIAKPDTVLIAIGVHTEHHNIQEALTDNAKRTNAVTEALKALDIPIEDIETTSFSIRPTYEHHNGTTALSGYEVEHWLEITVRDPKKPAPFTRRPLPVEQTSPAAWNSV